ncbi:MAG: lasso peptide biosynthesis B2 protein [Gemmatimonadetes bacterium]|nr:lasso peptide biosynthesis B2 protein [Gemmatimonadota bacterium]
MNAVESAIQKYPLPWSRLLTPRNMARLTTDCATALRLLASLRKRAITDLFPPFAEGGKFDLEGAALAAALTEKLFRMRAFPYRRTCLRRCLVLYHLFAKYGLRVRVAFGVDPSGEGDWAGHCWLLHEGEPFLEPAGSNDAYHAVFELPREGGDA